MSAIHPLTAALPALLVALLAILVAVPATAQLNPGCQDQDMDGFCFEQDDCDDRDPFINPQAPEQPCDGIDQNCNGLEDDNPNDDGDPVSLCENDCDDFEPEVYPGALEICDAVDNDCDALVDEDGACSSFCPDTITIDGCDSGVFATAVDGTCIQDLIDDCVEGTGNHGQLRSCITSVAVAYINPGQRAPVILCDNSKPAKAPPGQGDSCKCTVTEPSVPNGKVGTWDADDGKLTEFKVKTKVSVVANGPIRSKVNLSTSIAVKGYSYQVWAKRIVDGVAINPPQLIQVGGEAYTHERTFGGGALLKVDLRSFTLTENCKDQTLDHIVNFSLSDMERAVAHYERGRTITVAGRKYLVVGVRDVKIDTEVPSTYRVIFGAVCEGAAGSGKSTTKTAELSVDEGRPIRLR